MMKCNTPNKYDDLVDTFNNLHLLLLFFIIHSFYNEEISNIGDNLEIRNSLILKLKN